MRPNDRGIPDDPLEQTVELGYGPCMQLPGRRHVDDLAVDQSNESATSEPILAVAYSARRGKGLALGALSA